MQSATMQQREFQEIGHTGGKVTFNLVTNAQGKRQYQVGWTHQSPRSAALFAVWALPQGVAVAAINMAESERRGIRRLNALRVSQLDFCSYLTAWADWLAQLPASA